MLLLMVAFGPLGDVLLRKGMAGVERSEGHSPAALLHFFEGVFVAGYIWLGVGSLFLFFVSYSLVLSWADYSFVQPASAVGYVVVALLGYSLLGEVVTPVRWAGVGVICLGVALVGQTPLRTTEAP
jgi:drug/metabolite transporter (DMT)-like permease